MKRLSLAIFLLLCASCAPAQTSNVTATITDSDGQTWNNGTYSISFVPSTTNSAPPIWNGSPMTTAQKGPYTGTLSGTGVLTVSLPDNSFITPPNSQWAFTLCSNTSAPCSTVTLIVTGAAPNLSTTLSQGVKAPRFSATLNAYGYLDGEVFPIPVPGGRYFNVNSLLGRLWNGSAWINEGSGGTTTPGGANTDVQYNNSGAFGGDGNFTYNPSIQQITMTGQAGTATLFVNGVANSTDIFTQNGNVFLQSLNTTGTVLMAADTNDLNRVGVFGRTASCCGFTDGVQIIANQDSGSQIAIGAAGLVSISSNSVPISFGGPSTQTILSLVGNTSGSATIAGPSVAGTLTNPFVTSNAWQVGAPGTAGGVLGLGGSTSGVATFTAPAVAGTVTNPVLSSNAIQYPNGTALAPAILSTTAGTGIFFNGLAGNSLDYTYSTNWSFSLANNVFTASSAFIYAWTNGTPGGTKDTGLTRDSVAGGSYVDVGEGDANNTTGKVQAAGYISKGTTFTASGCTNSTLTGGATAGTFTVGQNTACTIVITMGNSATAPHGWNCSGANDETNVPTVAIRQTGHSTTSCSLLMTVATNDVITFSAEGF